MADEEIHSVEIGEGEILWSGVGDLEAADVSIVAFQYELAGTELLLAEAEEGWEDRAQVFAPTPVMVMQFIGTCGGTDHEHTLRVHMPIENVASFLKMLHACHDYMTKEM